MNWQERAEKAEAELARLREQKAALYMAFSDCGNFIRYWTRDTKNLEATMSVNDFEVLEFYAAPVPAPAVPKEWREAAQRLIDAAGDKTCSPSACSYPFECCNHDLIAAMDAMSALLQSAEVTK